MHAMKYLPFVLLAACIQPASSKGSLDSVGNAPTTLEELARYLFKNQDNPDAAVPKEALVNLEKWLNTFADEGRGVRQSTGFSGRSWTLKPLEDEDVAMLEVRPSRPLKNLLAGAVAYTSTQSLVCHAKVQASADHTKVEATAKTYVRSFLSDPACFLDGTCELQTENDILRASILFEARIVLLKNYRWFDYEIDGVSRRAFFGRGWQPETSDSTDGPEGNQLWQTYSIDVWIDRGGGEVLRFQTLWSENELFLAGARIDDASQLSTVASTVDGIFSATDRYIKDELKPAGLCL
jgi:hypothetical protein